MKRTLFAVAILAVVAASCGQKAADNSSSTASGGPGSSSMPSATPAMPAVSKYDSGPRAGESPVDAALAAKGEPLLKTKGCTACHGFGKRLTCPDLAGVSMRRTTAWMEQQILHPDVMVKEDPIAHALFAQYALQMPKQGLTPEEAKAVIEYFKKYDHDAGLTKSGAH